MSDPQNGRPRTTVYVLSVTRFKDGANLRLTVHATLEGAKAEGAKWAGEWLGVAYLDAGWREHHAEYARDRYWSLNGIGLTWSVVIDPREVEA